jgi:glycerophosphoryl diester phosphodiesterase
MSELSIRFPRVIGHRGAVGHAPENTLGGLRKAAELGATWVEFDVALTKDNVPVLMHDDTVNRTTDGSGNLADMTLTEVRALDAGRWFSDEFAGERVPTLTETIRLLDDLGLGANVEIKPTAGRESETGRIVAKQVADEWPNSLRAPVFSSFQVDALAAAQQAAPAIPRGWLMRRPRKDWQERARALDCLSVHCDHRALDRRTASEIRDAGYHLLAYTVNDAKRALKLFGWGVESVFSDYPDRILAI